MPRVHRDWCAGRCGRTMPAVLWTNGCILLMLWALGYAAGGTVGQWVHLFLLLAVVHFALGLVKAGRHLPRSRGSWGAPGPRA